MTKLDQLIKELCPDGVEYVTLGDIGTITRGNGLSKNDFAASGVGCIHYGQIYTYYGMLAAKTKSFVTPKLAAQLKTVSKGDIIIAVTSENLEDVCKCVVWLGDEDIVTGGHTAILKHNQNAKYIAYCLQTEGFFQQKRTIAHGIKVIEVTPSKLEDIKIPLPPLPVQHEIVRILDNFIEITAELTAELAAELTARKKQYEYYSDKLLTFGDETERKSLSDIAEIGTGNSNSNEGLKNGKYPFFVRSQEVRYKNEYEFDETAIITSGDGVGVGKNFHYIEGKYALHQRAYRIHITSQKVNPKFFYHYMKATFLDYITTNAYHASVTSIRRPMLNQYPVPIPELAEQQRIVEILDKFDALTTDIETCLPSEIEARRKQYEYYRDKLLTFKEVGA